MENTKNDSKSRNKIYPFRQELSRPRGKNKPNNCKDIETKFSPKTLKLNISSQKMSQSVQIKYLSKNK